jgi:hypothetical protein
VSGPDLPPSVAADLDSVATAYAQLRWHPVLRRRAAEVHAEVTVRAAAASAAVDGARVPVDVLRRTDVTDPAAGRDPALAVAVGAMRAMAAVDRAGATLLRAPGQVLARVHAGAAAGLVAPDLLGRPRPGAGDEVRALVDLLSAPASPSLPAAVRAGDAHAAVVGHDLFPPVSGPVGRAVARGVLVAAGLDPLGVALPEQACADDPAGYRLALRGGAAGEEGRRAWLSWWCAALVAGARAGGAAADAVALGRPA